MKHRDAKSVIPSARIGSLLHVLRQRAFRNSKDYWEHRYAAGGDSGAGSYGQLAQYKAAVLNDFVRDRQVLSVIEFGCGDGHQLTLSQYPRYIGLDVSATAIGWCAEKFRHDRSKSFFLYSPHHFVDNHNIFDADMAISLDVVYHLVEDDIFEAYLRQLFSAATRYVVIYSSDERLPDRAAHVRHREFTPWIETFIPNWRLLDRLTNPFREGTSAHFTIYERCAP